jgi:hypothetical protein
MQSKVPKHDNAVLIPQSDLIIIGQVRGMTLIANEAMKGSLDTSKYVGMLVELGVQEVLFDHINSEERLLVQGTGSMAIQVYVLGHPFGTDREVSFLPDEIYLVFLKEYMVEERKTTPLVVWNRSLKKWEGFPDPSTTYFMVIGGGDGLVPQKERYQDFIQETRRLCYEMRKQR